MKLFARLSAATLLAMAAAWSPSLMAAGDSATLHWTLATARIDNSPLPATAISETLIEWRRPGAAITTPPLGSMHVPAPATTITVQGLVCGDFDFVGYTIAKAAPVKSAATGAVLYPTGISCDPNPPGGLGAS